jgi:LysM repeat protein
MGREAPVGPVEQQVAAMFGPHTNPAEYRAAMRRIRCQTGQKDRFRAGVIRSGAYIDEIKRIFRSKGLPEDLSYLPHVESSFNPKAYSKFGAAGMWQFTRSTGKYYMKVGYTIDERRDPIISSYAAAKLLRHNYRKLHHWPMAITAYNHGVSGMLRAKRKKGSYERIFKEYRSRIFKFASRNFYSEFLAAREAAKNYRQYFGDLKLDTPVKSREVVLKGYVSLPQMARHLNLEIAELRKLNPALRHPVFRGQKYVPKGYRLKLPYKNDEDWGNLVAKIEDKFYKHDQKKSRIYTVQRGDTAGEVARIHGVKLADLIAANNLNSRATIYINQNLRIPLPDEKPILVAKRQSNYPQKTKDAVASPSKPIEKVALPQADPATRLLIASRSTAQTSKGVDPNKKLAAAHDRSMPVSDQKTDLAQEKASKESTKDQPESSLFVANPMVEYDPNLKRDTQPSVAVASSEADKPETESAPVLADLAPDAEEKSRVSESSPANQAVDQATSQLPDNKPLKAGKVEKITGPQQSAGPEEKSQPEPSPEMETRPLTPATSQPQNNPEVVLANLVIKKTWNYNGKKVGILRVEVEETLGHYAEWLNVSAREIRRLNGFRYGRALHLNQKIKIPLHRVTQDEFVEKRFEYHQELVEDFFASYRVDKVLTYSIKKGDNIWTLSHQEFEVPLWLIKRYNAGVDFSALVPSQKLLIPIIEKNV